VATVDRDDDGIRRYVVRRYARDPQRHERRHQVVAAFDNKREFRRLLDRLARDLQHRRDAGEPIDAAEHYTGVLLEPGHVRRQRDGHLLKRAIAHGVSLSDQQLERLDLPSNMALLRLVRKTTRG
jgi:hypothetical protein